MMTRRPGLDRYDQSGDARWEARAARKRADKPPAEYLRVLAMPGCWCGGRFDHDWPGKADGEPHPRDWPGRVNGHPYR